MPTTLAGRIIPMSITPIAIRSVLQKLEPRQDLFLVLVVRNALG